LVLGWGYVLFYDKTPQEPIIEQPELADIVPEPIPDIIYRIAKEFGIDPNMALWVADCESNFNPNAYNGNDPYGGANGLYQIIYYWHPTVTPECAYNPACSTEYFAKMVEEGNGNLWACYNQYYAD